MTPFFAMPTVIPLMLSGIRLHKLAVWRLFVSDALHEVRGLSGPIAIYNRLILT